MKRKLVFGTSVLFAAGVFAQTTGANLSTQDREFIDKAAQINMTEAHLGKLAQEKASSQEIKQFGEQLRTDHTQAYERLTKIANDTGATLAKEINSEHQNHIQRFENLSGEQFDREFRQHQVQDHQKAIDAFQNYSNNGENADLKAYASEMLPKLRSHLERAQNLNQSTTTTNAAADRSTTQTGEVHSATVAPSGTGEVQSSSAQSAAPAVPAPGTTGDADRTAQSEETNVHYGTVTKYESGKIVELKMRDRAGRHSYDLSEGNLKTDIPADIRVGSQVRVTEKVDKNGHRSIMIEPDTASADRTNERQ